jgi:hypothetical protein
MAQHAYSHIAFAECKPPAHARVASGKMTIRALTRTQNTFAPGLKEPNRVDRRRQVPGAL